MIYYVHLGDHMIRETDSNLSDDDEVANQSVHFALQQDKQSGIATPV